MNSECRYVCPTNNFYNNKTLIEIAHLIENQKVINSLVLYPQFVGILNITPDSFSDEGLSLYKENGVDYLRVHNVMQHQRFFVAEQIVKGFYEK